MLKYEEQNASFMTLCRLLQRKHRVPIAPNQLNRGAKSTQLSVSACQISIYVYVRFCSIVNGPVVL